MFLAPDEEYLDFGELITMKASQPAFLTRPLIIVEDDDAVENLGLAKVYENIINPDDLDKFFNMSLNKMETVLEKSPKGIKKLIISKAREMIENNQLYDIRKIQLLEKTLKIDLQIFFND